MPSYVTLINYTGRGVENFRDTLDRAQDFRSAVERAGGRLRELLWTMGPYDIVALVDAPDDETVTALSLAVSARGFVRTTTLRAFDAEAMQQIIGRTG